ncbi:MAG TPA: sensor histidine kinase KdpD, partial [Deinococcales bacterium]|nr:sensor histidine kinase KdpD [Deinococcales bacterium]
MTRPPPERPDPDALLRSLDPPPGRGRHKIYVGMAAGVGKTVRALQELRELQAAGHDVAIGLLETHGRAGTEAAAAGLPVFPLRQVPHQGAWVAELNVAGLMADAPEYVLVDELAHSNAPGAGHEKRHEDVEDLLAAGIHVISTMNVQHLESLNDLIARLTGVRVRERVPDRILREASEVVLVDVTPGALRERLQ